MFKKVFLSVFLFLYTNVCAYELPTLFIGTYNENNKKLIENLVTPNLLSSQNDRWGLTKYTEILLQNDFKKTIGTKKFNIILKNDFDKNYKKIITESDDSADKKIGFFNINTFENSIKLASGQELVYITINLIFAELGEEANRANVQSNFEVRYTNGITTTGVLGIQPGENRKKKLQDGYQKFYKKTLLDLINNIIHDTSSKKVTSFAGSDDVFFSITRMVIGKKSKDLALKVFKNEKVAKVQILMILQEALIKEIRKDSRLDNVVLLYPDILNNIIFKNWKDYLKRINSVFLDTNKNNSSDIIFRKLKKACEKPTKQNSVLYVDGYFIETIINELYDELVEKKDVNSIRYIKSSIASRVVLGLEDKKKIDGLSTPSNILKKKKMAVGQESFGYDIVNKLTSIQKNKVTKTVRKSIEKMAPKLKKLILDIIIQREKDISFSYQKFCKE